MSINSQKCDILLGMEWEVFMAVSYKKLLHKMIEEDISGSELMERANISANILTKIRREQYIALNKLESICLALNCTPNDVLEFVEEGEMLMSKERVTRLW